MRIFVPGECELSKAGIHGAIGGLAAVCLVYNCWSFGKRHDLHLLVNTGLYAALVAWELAHVQHHLNGR